MNTADQKKFWLFIGIGLSGLIVAIDYTIVNTVLPLIQNDLSAPMNLLQWVMTGFGITFASLLITMGRLGDLMGHRSILFAGIIGFGLTSLGAGLSTTIHELIVARIFQGIFGATVFPCGIAILSSAFSHSEQGRVLGKYGSILGIGLAMGPVLGGLITSIASWRWIFLMNLPIIFISAVICAWFIPISQTKKGVPMDWMGMLLLTVFLGTFVFVITQNQVYGLTSPLIFLPLIVACMCLVLFIYIEMNSVAPLLPFHVIHNRAFFICAMVYSICVGLSWTVMFFVPLYLQTVLALNEFQLGLMLLPLTIMTVIAPAIAGYMYDREGPYLTTVLAFLTMIIGLFLSVFFSTTLMMTLIILSFVSIGVSWGIGNGVATPLALSNPENKAHEGVISGAAITILNVVGILMLSISTALFHYLDQYHLGLVHNDVDAFLSAFHGVMWLLFIISIIGFVMVLFAFRKGRGGLSEK